MIVNGRRYPNRLLGLVVSSRRGLDVFVYFNNDMEGHAINDAKTLISLVAVK